MIRSRTLCPLYLVLIAALSSCIGWLAPKKGFFVVNVLDKEFFEDCHIKGSINVPLALIEDYFKDFEKEETEIVLYCSNYLCTSSEYAYKQLRSMGFKKIFVYEGGTAEWYQEGRPYGGKAKKSYLMMKLTPSLETKAYSLQAQELQNKMEKERS